MSTNQSVPPPPVPWSAEREARGGGGGHTPRCTERGCPVRYAAGDDRACREHTRAGQADTMDARAWSLARVRLGMGRRWPDYGTGPDEPAGASRPGTTAALRPAGPP